MLTDEAFAAMTALAGAATPPACRPPSTAHALPWSISQLGARAEYRFAAPAPRTGNASAAAADPDLDEFFHLYLANRGILLTPFHNMALMCPATTAEQVELHGQLFEAAVTDLLS